MTLERIDQTLNKLFSEIEAINSQITGINSEITGIKSEITGINSEITGIKSEITGINKRLNKHEIKFNDFREEQLRQSVLLESLDNDFKILNEAVVYTNKLKSSSDNHETRINQLELDNKLTKSVVTIHSKKLKTLDH